MRTLAGLGGSHRNLRSRFWLGTATKRRLWVAVAVASIVTSGLAATAAADSAAPSRARRGHARRVHGVPAVRDARRAAR